jgi:hypothetical protein
VPYATSEQARRVLTLEEGNELDETLVVVGAVPLGHDDRVVLLL